MATPLSRVRHLGSAHSGTRDFWRQRLTGAANVPLVLGFIAVIFAVAGQPYDTVVNIIGSPLVSGLLILLLVSVTIHMRIGMQVIVEDYIHGEALKVVLLVASTFFAVVVATIGILSILKLAFGA
jgi:succinate dehydrogenase / fumarate reductase membrane anchor subunit